MRIKTLIDEDFVNYKKSSMFIGSISCGGKCCIEGGIPLSVCQNDGWRKSAPIDVRDENIVKRYMNNGISQAIVLGGLEPMEQPDEVVELVRVLREDFGCHDDVVIYTGYYPDEVSTILDRLREFDNIIVKFGRYIPNMKPRFDDVLGVWLASNNQYVERIS